MEQTEKISKKSIIIFAIEVLIVVLIGVGIYLVTDIIADRRAAVYTAEDFGIETVKADMDFNGNGIDDYTDMVTGARNYVETKPVYKGDYVAGGYPPKGEGVCTDVIWMAFMEAG